MSLQILAAPGSLDEQHLLVDPFAHRVSEAELRSDLVSELFVAMGSVANRKPSFARPPLQ